VDVVTPQTQPPLVAPVLTQLHVANAALYVCSRMGGPSGPFAKGDEQDPFATHLGDGPEGAGQAQPDRSSLVVELHVCGAPGRGVYVTVRVMVPSRPAPKRDAQVGYVVTTSPTHRQSVVLVSAVVDETTVELLVLQTRVVVLL
jgi:hypothetical protein